MKKLLINEEKAYKLNQSEVVYSRKLFNEKWSLRKTCLMNWNRNDLEEIGIWQHVARCNLQCKHSERVLKWIPLMTCLSLHDFLQKKEKLFDIFKSKKNLIKISMSKKGEKEVEEEIFVAKILTKISWCKTYILIWQRIWLRSFKILLLFSSFLKQTKKCWIFF